jgi:hypothetical protein
VTTVGFIGSGNIGGTVARLADSWRQESGTPVYGPPYGTFENEKGTPAGEDVIRAALAAAAPGSPHAFHVH